MLVITFLFVCLLQTAMVLSHCPALSQFLQNTLLKLLSQFPVRVEVTLPLMVPMQTPALLDGHQLADSDDPEEETASTVVPEAAPTDTDSYMSQVWNRYMAEAFSRSRT